MANPKPGVRRATDRAMAKAGLGSAGRLADRAVRQGIKSGMTRKAAIQSAVTAKTQRRAGSSASAPGRTAGPSRVNPMSAPAQSAGPSKMGDLPSRTAGPVRARGRAGAPGQIKKNGGKVTLGNGPIMPGRGGAPGRPVIQPVPGPGRGTIGNVPGRKAPKPGNPK